MSDTDLRFQRIREALRHSSIYDSATLIDLARVEANMAAMREALTVISTDGPGDPCDLHGTPNFCGPMGCDCAARVADAVLAAVSDGETGT